MNSKKEAYDYADSELKKINIDGFRYEGSRGNDTTVFAFKKVVNEDDSYCIVLDGSDDGDVEIEAETDYNSGADEYIDKIASFGSWKEAIEYLKRNTRRIIEKVEEKYDYHKNIKAKTARIVKSVVKSFILE